jgi:hypothetical protein
MQKIENYNLLMQKSNRKLLFRTVVDINFFSKLKLIASQL